MPYLLAENPDLSWKEAKNLSKQMTHGYKWKMFLVQMSYLYLLIPAFLLHIIDIFIILPIDYTAGAEMYFTLRQRPDIDRSILIETAFDGDAYVDRVKAGETATGIFIYPGYEFKVIDSLITNFHLPKSTLMMLMSALYDREKILKIYEEAVRERYRFFSYGDAMFII